MDEEQKQKFMEWLHTTERVYRVDLEKAWQACLEANKVEEEPEPSPTEMMRRLIDKGWEINVPRDISQHNYTKLQLFLYRDDVEQVIYYPLDEAYRRAFPSKKKVEVEVWMSKRGTVTEKGQNVRNSPYSKDWTKGTATFYVEESGG